MKKIHVRKKKHEPETKKKITCKAETSPTPPQFLSKGERPQILTGRRLKAQY